MNRRKLAATLALVCAFVLGAVAGGFGAKSYMLHRFADRLGGPPGRARMGFRIEAMTRALDLDAAQRDKVHRIMEAHEDERRTTFERCEPEHRALRAKIDAEIRDVLSPQQREKYEQMLKRHERRGPPH